MENKETWIDPEDRAYPYGGFTRQARVRVLGNPHAPGAVPDRIIGQYRMVRASVPDTHFSIPARLRVDGRTVRGFVSYINDELTFTPEAT